MTQLGARVPRSGVCLRQNSCSVARFLVSANARESRAHLLHLGSKTWCVVSGGIVDLLEKSVDRLFDLSIVGALVVLLVSGVKGIERHGNLFGRPLSLRRDSIAVLGDRLHYRVREGLIVRLGI